MAGVFYSIGYVGAKYPCTVFILCLTLTCLFSLGMYNLRVLTDPQELWVSQSSRTYKEQEDSAANFGPFYRTNQFILVFNDPNWVNIFNKEALYVLYFLQNIIATRKVDINGKNQTLDDMCYKPISGKGCIVPSPMDIWLQDPRLLEKDEDIQFTTLCTESIDINQTNIPCSDRNGIPVILESVFGGISCEERKFDTQPCDHCYIMAKTLSVTYLLNNDKFTKEDAEIWEKHVWMDTLDAYNRRDYDKLYKYYDSELMDKLPEKILDQYKVVFMAERSVSDEIDRETNQNAWIVVVSYVMMFLYIGIAIGQFPSKIYNGFTLGLGGIFIVGASMFSSIGIVSYFNIGMTMISMEVIPFLILAIGVDNMFIITHNFKKQKAATVPERMGRALKSVGPSITIAAICETLAFIVGALTKMPALQSFCIQAAVGVFIDYVFQLTMFVAFLTWDEYRKKHKRYDLFFWKRDSSYKMKEDRKLVQHFFKNYYTPFLQKPNCIFITLAIFVGLFTISCIGVTRIQVGLEEQVSMVEGSDLYNYMTYEKKYIEIGPLVYLILEGLDYQNDADLKLVATLSNSLSQLNETVQPPIYSWVASFNLFIRESAEWTTACKTEDISLYDFPTQLKKFLSVRINSACCQRYGICGEQYEFDIVMNDAGTNIKTSRLRFQHTPIHDSAGYILALEQTRQVIDKVVEVEFKDRDQGDRKVYAYSMPYVYYDQYSYIRAVAITNVLLALATIFFTMTLFQDVVCALLVVLFVFLIAFNLVGTVWLCNVIFGGFAIEINAISVVNLVTCLGLAVEFVAHIVVKFRMVDGTRWNRVQDAMSTMGTSVFVGIACTKFIGVVVLGFAPSNLFKLYYFRMYILMVILGTFNGLVLLPVFLGLIGPGVGMVEKRKVKVINKSEEDKAIM